MIQIGNPEDTTAHQSPLCAKKLIESRSGVLVWSLLSLLLGVGLSSIIGIMIWEALKGFATTVTASPEVFVAASVGAVASMIGGDGRNRLDVGWLT